MSTEVTTIKEVLTPHDPCFEIDESMSLKEFLDSLTGSDLAWGLSCAPKLVRYLSKEYLDKISPFDWAYIVYEQPSMASVCPWHTFLERDWVSLLQASPDYISRCPVDTLSEEAWGAILRYQPHLGYMFPQKSFV